MAAADLPLLHTRLASRYRIERTLGEGGMGAVYLARELGLDRPVALKVLPPAFATDGALRERFLRETRLAASFAHPNIVPVYAVEEHDDLLAFTMAFVEGETLSDRVRRTGPLTAREAVRLMHDIAYALAYAHGRGIVHRDVKPDNLLLDRATSRALLMDFGVARPSSAAPSAPAGMASAGPASADGLTRVGEVVGTPEYMSPEQATSDHVDGRSDLYALGLVLWFALTGRTAMAAENTQRVIVRQLTERLPPLATARPDLPAALCRAVDRCLEKDPDARFADAAALAQALDDAELAAPEIPIPVRAAATELRTMTLALPIVLLFGVTIVLRSGIDNLDAFIPVVVLVALLIARIGLVLGDLSRLRRFGYSAADVQRGLRAVLDEAASAREVARLDPETRIARREALRTAAVMFAAGVVSMAIAWSLREPNPGGGHSTGPLGVALLFNGLACVGVAVTLALRDPRRMMLGERCLRLVWLHPPGTTLVRLAMRGAAPTPARIDPISRVGVTGEPITGEPITGAPRARDVGAPATRTPPPGTASANEAPPLGARSAYLAPRSLEQRVAHLEDRLDDLESRLH